MGAWVPTESLTTTSPASIAFTNNKSVLKPQNFSLTYTLYPILLPFHSKMVLVLSTLHNLLTQMLALPELHTAILLTTEGQLISVASDPSRPKDKARILAGVSGEIYQETKDQGFGMVESEVSVSPRVFSNHPG